MNIGYTGTFREGMHAADVYPYENKQIALTKNGKEYGNPVIQDKTGTTDAKMRDLSPPRVRRFEAMDYVHVEANVTLFQSSFQLSVRRICRAQEGEYMEVDYLPVLKKDMKGMYEELLGYIRSVKNPYPQRLLCGYFVENAASAKVFQFHFAARAVYHGFVGGLLEHTLSVTRLCDHYTGYYPMINRDLLLAAAILHDIDETKELSRFPESDYTDDGRLPGHIIAGAEMVGESIRSISGSPEKLAIELKHCILTHHGESEYGLPKKPALLEVSTLNFVDNTDTGMGATIEVLWFGGDNKG